MNRRQNIVRDVVFVGLKSIVSLSNGIIFTILVLLFYFGEHQLVLFLSLATVSGICIGIVNDVRARLALERLHVLTTPIYTRVRKNGVEEKVTAEALDIGDTILLRLGDQVPCDAQIIEAHTIEISQSLLTGESDSFAKKEGDTVLAGSVVVAGYAVVRIHTTFQQSELSKMTNTIKRFELQASPVQQSIQTVLHYSGFGIFAVLSFVVARGIYLYESKIAILSSAAALTSTLMPQGLVVAVTLLFAYGAIRMYKEHVLIQDLSATEKIGNIQNLCIDKTGTLTENTPTVECMHVYSDGKEKEAVGLTKAYIVGSGDSSQTARAIEQFTHSIVLGELRASLPFTSQRQYGAITTTYEQKTFALVMGGPDVLLPHIEQWQGKEWLTSIVKASKPGRRLVCVARAGVGTLPTELTGVALVPIVVYELASVLRPGTKAIIDFFQARGVRIRVISGDSPETVKVVAAEAGINNANSTVLGSDIEGWSEDDFMQKLNTYTVFARVRPQMKEQLIERFKKQGYTAMVGDGANDALAIKKADVGIAMFEGAQATRQVASVVLMNNSFSALPRGIRFADTIIGNAEIIASVYFFEMMVGFLLFVSATLTGASYQFSPQNIILFNYCSVACAGILTFYWAMRGINSKVPSKKSFLKRTLPFALYSGVIAGSLLVFLYVVLGYVAPSPHLQTILLFTFILESFIFFCIAPIEYAKAKISEYAVSVSVYGLGIFLILFCAIQIAGTRLFFSLKQVSLFECAIVLSVGIVFAALQWLLIYSRVGDNGLTQ